MDILYNEIKTCRIRMIICSYIHSNKKKNHNGFFKRRFSYLYNARKPAGFLIWIFSFCLYKIRIMLVLMHVQIANYITRITLLKICVLKLCQKNTESVHCNMHSVFRVHVILTNMLTTHLRVPASSPVAFYFSTF